MKHTFLLVCIACLMSCKHQPTIFLGYKLLSSKDEYYAHRTELINNRKIISGTKDLHTMDCGSLDHYSDGVPKETTLSFEIAPTFIDNKLDILTITTVQAPANELRYDEATGKAIGFRIKDTTHTAKVFKCLMNTYVLKYGKHMDTLGYWQLRELIHSADLNEKEIGYCWKKDGYKVIISFDRSMFNLGGILDPTVRLTWRIFYVVDNNKTIA